MKQSTINNVTRVSNAIFQKDENGLIELTPKAAAVALVTIAILFLLVSKWAG